MTTAFHRRWIAAALLVLVAILSYSLRRELVLAFFPDGTPGSAPPLTPAPADAPQHGPAASVRVLLIDGLLADTADRLPELSKACASGIDVRVDTGFPTVSLPVQHALWTGRTQSQAGIMYRIPRLSQPPVDALPIRVPGSIAIAESHPEIVHSFGFTHAEPPTDDPTIVEEGSAWRAEGFAAAARRAVASPASLVFVHVLRVDEVGHASGAVSARYGEAATWADELFAQLLVAAGSDVRWFVLADHGHRPAGGHGGAEPSIRIVRACVIGPGIAAADHRDAAPVHLVDLHREIADALDLAPAPEAAGRPLPFALAHPDRDATLPRPTTAGIAVAIVLALVAIVAAFVAVGRRVSAWPWWLPVAYVSVVLIHGWPTLSNPMVYPPLGSAMIFAAAPGAIVLAVTAVQGLRRHGVAATIAAQLVPAFALLAAALALCGVFERILGVHARPPLVPIWTAHASLGFTLCLVGAAVLAIVLAIADPQRQRAGTRR